MSGNWSVTKLIADPDYQAGMWVFQSIWTDGVGEGATSLHCAIFHHFRAKFLLPCSRHRSCGPKAYLQCICLHNCQKSFLQYGDPSLILIKSLLHIFGAQECSPILSSQFFLVLSAPTRWHFCKLKYFQVPETGPFLQKNKGEIFFVCPGYFYSSQGIFILAWAFL